jgi:hypothetical protein
MVGDCFKVDFIGFGDPELLEKSPEGGFADEGVTIHVFDASDGHEYLRFDVFDDEPHYHYIHRTVGDTVVNNVIDFDVPPTASHKNNSAKLVRANAAAFCKTTDTGVAQRLIRS